MTEALGNSMLGEQMVLERDGFCHSMLLNDGNKLVVHAMEWT